MYDGVRVRECFDKPGPRWADEQDEIAAMQMGYRSHALLMKEVIGAFLDTLDEHWGVATVLDVGCGTGMFLNYVAELRMLHRVEKYTGYELVPRFAEKAQGKLQELGVRGEVLELDFFAATSDTSTSQLVIASQCLNTVFTKGDPHEFLAYALKRLWLRTENRLVFDLKDVQAPHRSEDRSYYDPVRVLEMCRTLTQNVSIKQVTKANFTVVMARRELT